MLLLLLLLLLALYYCAAAGAVMTALIIGIIAEMASIIDHQHTCRHASDLRMVGQ